jgi:hypothetical protein
MDKYQQALVRPSLKSLLSVPMFDHKRIDKHRDVQDNPLLGVINFDSDDLKLEAFLNSTVMRAAADIAKIVERKLNT